MSSVRVEGMWTNAVLVGGFTLAGAAMQQALAHWTDVSRARVAREDLRRDERHHAVVDAVKAGRRVQRALADSANGRRGTADRYKLEDAVNSLTESVAAVRVVIDSPAVVEAFRVFEEHAKELQRLPQASAPVRNLSSTLRLSPLISAIQVYENQR